MSRRMRREKRDRAVTFILALAGIGLSLVGIIWAAICWFICLLFLADWLGNIERSASWSKKKIRVIQAGTIASCVALGLLPIRNQWRTEKAAATKGELVAISDGKDHSNEPPKFQVGDSWIVTWTGTGDGPIKNDQLDKINIRRVGNEIKFSTTVRDSRQNLIVEITDNRWRVSPEKANCWDKNYTKDSLEVKDGRGRVSASSPPSP